MKKILLSAAALTLLATSCKKDDDNNTPSNGWVLNGTQFNTATTSYNIDILSAVSTSPVGAFYADFSAMPSAGSYTITDGTASTTGEVGIAVTSGTTTYTASAYNTSKANVAVNGSKITISFSDIWVINENNNKDSVKLSANVTQL